MRIIILAAGYGTRLYPLTIDLPKPLICINNKPVINFLIDKIDNLKEAYPIEDIRIVTNNKFYSKFLDWKQRYKIDACIVNDGTNRPGDRLGAVRDIKIAINKQNSDWLVLGGDNLFEDNLQSFIKFALRNKPAPSIGIYDVRDKKTASNYGVVELDSKGQIIKFWEKPPCAASTLAATCVYFFPEESISLFDAFFSQVKNSDACGEYIKWMASETKVYGYVFEKKWFDVGASEVLKTAERVFK